mmetsp:Transcript_35175/g.67654  ORF Transcript_35175/g.67654 Transcript_35175/m.67654 type:complete len:153 (-) Transcript_35175:1254-1712(-)
MHAGRQGATRAASANIYPPPRFFLFYAICRCRSRWRSSVPAGWFKKYALLVVQWRGREVRDVCASVSESDGICRVEGDARQLRGEELGAESVDVRVGVAVGGRVRHRRHGRSAGRVRRARLRVERLLVHHLQRHLLLIVSLLRKLEVQLVLL